MHNSRTDVLAPHFIRKSSSWNFRRQQRRLVTHFFEASIYGVLMPGSMTRIQCSVSLKTPEFGKNLEIAAWQRPRIVLIHRLGFQGQSASRFPPKRCGGGYGRNNESKIGLWILLESSFTRFSSCLVDRAI
ncbi:hypothetical protein AVEN_151179-1 [Araneus ventricosus]|uniref:Uncharacterized protein n=1 Tax=Araneus ventricosus TaxID=182803 RepID=A0A4Y2Q394_ARAVE|nr:hypothetical protein AVEN_151179-1 [Araneus ventricosus]